jgi:hypothetical protein
MELSDPQWQPSARVWPCCVLAISEGAGGGSYRLFSTGFALLSLREPSEGAGLNVACGATSNSA